MFRIATAAFLFLAGLSASGAEVNTGSAVEVKIADGHGSGVYIGNGYVLTAGHVAKAGIGQDITIVRARDGGWEDNWTAVVVWVDEAHDFGLLKIKAADVPVPVAKIDCTPPTLGQDVTIAGWPVSLGLVISRGYVAGGDAKRGDWENSFIVIAPVFFGNSGGPVYTSDGKVIALAVGIVNGTSLSIVAPIAAVCDELPAGVK